MLGFVIGWFLFTTVASATTTSSLEQNLRREMVTLPYYSIFDNVSFELEGSNVTLTGEVWWPALKRSIERVVGKVEGITGVNNQITVLPNSYRDDDLRLATARAHFFEFKLE
jgi:osmotically-inducible protein OsmY